MKKQYTNYSKLKNAYIIALYKRSNLQYSSSMPLKEKKEKKRKTERKKKTSAHYKTHQVQGRQINTNILHRTS